MLPPCKRTVKNLRKRKENSLPNLWANLATNVIPEFISLTIVLNGSTLQLTFVTNALFLYILVSNTRVIT